jgi:hypothetical protein
VREICLHQGVVEGMSLGVQLLTDISHFSQPILCRGGWAPATDRVRLWALSRLRQSIVLVQRVHACTNTHTHTHTQLLKLKQMT